MDAQPYHSGAEDEHGLHRRCTGHVTGSSDDLVDCRRRATRVIWEADGMAYFACHDPGHIGNAARVQPIGEFFVDLHVSILAEESERALAACVIDP